MSKNVSFLVLCLIIMALSSPVKAQDIYRYEVRQDDTIYGLAQKYFRNGTDFTKIVRLNNIRDPRRLQPGTILEIPREYLQATAIQAQVIAFRGSVSIEATNSTRLPAKLGLLVGEGATIETGAKAFATISTEEGVRATLPSQSTIRIVRLRRYWIDGFVERKFALLKGRSKWDADSIRTGSGGEVIITTPTSTSAVRGTTFRVGIADPNAERTTVTVLKGIVEVSRSKAATYDSVAVEAGFGVAANDTSVSAPRKLLKSPRLLDPDKIQSTDRLQFEVSPLANANAYRFALGSDAGMLDVFDEETSAIPVVQFDAPPTGQYYLEVSALDNDSLEGMPRVYEFRRREASVSRESARHQDYDGKTIFSWRTNENSGALRFILSRQRSLSEPLVDKVGIEGERLVISDLDPGNYFWTVQEISVHDGEIEIFDRPIAELVIPER